MTTAATLTDFIVPFDPTHGPMGAAEFAAALCALFEVPLVDLEDTLASLPAARLVRLLQSDDAASLRERLGVLDPRLCSTAAAQALARVGADGTALLDALREALLAVAGRPPMTEAQERAARISRLKQALLEEWPRAFDRVAQRGFVDERGARALGVGPAVYAALLAGLGRPGDDLVAREEFLEAAPRLVQFWPLTEEGEQALAGLVRLVARAAAGRGLGMLAPVEAAGG